MAPVPDPLDDTTILLNALIERNFRFSYLRDADGDLVAVHGVRVHDNVIDLVVLRAEDDARAVRMPGDEPHVLQPGTILWETTGHAGSVLGKVLALPDRSASQQLAGTGCWIPVRPGRAVWLRASSA
jgi:hypothetical protein